LTEARCRFEAALPAMDRVYRYQFRKFPRARRADAVAEARAVTWAAWYGLLRRGRDPVAVGPTGIATRSCLPVKMGRQLAGARLDIFDPRARRCTVSFRQACKNSIRRCRLERGTGWPWGGSRGLARGMLCYGVRPATA
jgi:hypothetical protein